MKKSIKFIAAAGLFFSIAGGAMAEDIKIDFDGTGAKAAVSKETSQTIELPEAAQPKPEKVSDKADKTTVTIKTVMKNGEKTSEETLTCKAGQGEDKVAECKKSDSTELTYKDLETLSLRSYFSEETLQFADLLNQNKHSYTNQSGPMTFSCHDSCANHELVSLGLSTSPPFIESFEIKCVEWTHECDCVAGCNN